MCGIGAVISSSNSRTCPKCSTNPSSLSSSSEQICEKILNILTPRGPDYQNITHVNFPIACEEERDETKLDELTATGQVSLIGTVLHMRVKLLADINLPIFIILWLISNIIISIYFSLALCQLLCLGRRMRAATRGG